MTTFPAKVPGIGGTPTEFRNKILGIVYPEKKHTIRLPRKGKKQWAKDVPIHFAQGGYRKGVQRIFAEGVCTGVQSITIYTRLQTVWINETANFRVLSKWQVEQLAINDGFANVADFYAYFSHATNGSDFHGRLIHWTPLTY